MRATARIQGIPDHVSKARTAGRADRAGRLWCPARSLPDARRDGLIRAWLRSSAASAEWFGRLTLCGALGSGEARRILCRLYRVRLMLGVFLWINERAA